MGPRAPGVAFSPHSYVASLLTLPRFGPRNLLATRVMKHSKQAQAPTLHPFLAKAVAAEIAAMREADGSPTTFRVAEYGGGEGDLGRTAMACLSGPDYQWLHVELNPAHRAHQESRDARIRPAVDGT